MKLNKDLKLLSRLFSKRLSKRVISFIMAWVLVISTFAGDYMTMQVRAEGAEELYHILLNNALLEGSTMEVQYGEPLSLSLQGVEDNGAINYYYSRYQSFTDEDDNPSYILIVQNSSDFSKELSVGTTYYVAYNGTVNSQNVDDTDGNHSFIIRKATLSAPVVSWSTFSYTNTTRNIVASWESVTTATNGVALLDDAVAGYEITLTRNGAAAEVTADHATSVRVAADVTSYNLSTIIPKNAYGEYVVSVKAIVADSAATYYNDSAVGSSEKKAYLDETAPVITTAPSLTQAEQTLSFAAKDNETGIAAYAITQDANLSSDASDWTSISNPGAENIAGKDILKRELQESDSAGEYYFYVKDENGNITKSDASVHVHKIIYKNDGDDTTLKDTAFFYAGDTYTLKEPAYAGYTFVNWYLDESLTQVAPSSIGLSDLTDDSLTVYAKWKISDVSFSTQPNDGEDYAEIYDGLAHTISAAITNTVGTINWKWQKKNGAEWEDIDGATTNAISVKHVADSGTYRAVVTVTIGSDTTSLASKEVNVSISKASLSVKAENKAIAYGDAKPEFTYALSGFVGEDDKDSIELTVGTVKCEAWEEAQAAGTLPLPKNTYDITPSGFSAPDYNISYVGGIGKLTVGAKDVNAEDSKVTATLSETSYVYTETAGVGTENKPAVTVKDGEAIIPASEYSVEYVNCVLPGTAKAVITFNKNYKGTIEAEYTITAASFDTTVSLAGWKYGETENVPSIASNVSGGKVTYYYETKSGEALGTKKPVHAGEYKVYAVIAANGGYGQTTTEKVDFVITKRTLIVTAGSKEWEYDGNAHSYESYTITGDGFIVGDDFQSIVITGSITDKGKVDNIVKCTLPDHIVPTDYEITEKKGELSVIETSLQVPGGIEWSTKNAGKAEWVSVVKKDLEITYKIQLYRVDSAGTYTAISEAAGGLVSTQSAEYDFSSVIYEDSKAIYAANPTANSVAYVFSVQAIPTGGTTAGNYKISNVSLYKTMDRLGTVYVSLNKDDTIETLTAHPSALGGTIETVDSFVAIAGERVGFHASCDAKNKLSGSVWTVNAEDAGYLYSSSGTVYDSQTQSDWVLTVPKDISVNTSCAVLVSAHASDREPVIEEFSAEVSDDRQSVTFTMKASDGIGISGWKLVKDPGDIKKAIAPKASDAGWKTSGIASNGLTMNASHTITIPAEAAPAVEGTYYLFVKDSSGNVVGGWLYEKAEEFAVNNIYKLTFAKGEASATGSMNSLLKLEDESLVLPAVGYVNAGKSFKNWKTSSSAILEDGATYILNQNDTLTATWTSKQYSYKVVYHYEELDEDDQPYYKEEADLAEGETFEYQTFKAGYNEVIDPSDDENYSAIHKLKQGFEFDATNTGTLTIADTMDEQILHIYYKRSTYQISYSYTNITGSTVSMGNQSYLYGQAVNPKAQPAAIPGYKFVGWLFGETGSKPETMPAQDMVATGSYVAQKVSYYVVYYTETLTTGEYSFDGIEERSAMQGDEITMGIYDITSVLGLTNSKVVAVSGSENAYSSTVPAGAKTTATGTATAAPGEELYFVFYRMRNSYKLSLKVWKGDRLEDNINVYTHSWTLKYGQPLDADIDYANYGYPDAWATSATEKGIDLSGTILAAYEDWSTETRPATMPFGEVVVNREYIPERVVPYNIDVYLEQADGTYTNSGTSLLYSGVAGSKVSIGNGAGYTVDYNTLSASVHGFEYYQYVKHPDEVLSGIVGADEDDRLHLKIFFERKKYKVTLRFYDSTTHVFKEIIDKYKWGTNFTFDPDQYFDYDSTNYAEGTEADENTNSFRNKNYVVSYATYYWTPELNQYGEGGRWSTKNLETIQELENNYTVQVGQNDSTYAYIYYLVPEIEKDYYFNVGYSASNLKKATEAEKAFNQLTIEDADGNSYKIRVANKSSLYNITPNSGTTLERYPGMALKNGNFSYGTLKTGFTLVDVTYKGLNYSFPAKDGYIYIPNTKNQFYKNNRISFNYNTGEGSTAELSSGGYKLMYSMIEDFLAQYKIDHADDMGEDADPSGASTARIYNPGSSLLCGDDSSWHGHNYTYTFYYDNYLNVTYRLDGNVCSGHNYYYGETVTVGCDHEGTFPARDGYDIVWYTSDEYKTLATDFVIHENTILYGRYEKSILLCNEYLVFPLADGITVGGVSYTNKLTEAQVLAIKEVADPNYVVDISVTTSDIECYDAEWQITKTITCDNTMYTLNGVPVLLNRKRPSTVYSDVEMAVDDVENPTYTTMQQYAPEGFRFDDTNIGNKLKGYVQSTPISLYAYFIRNNYKLTTERLLSDTDNAKTSIMTYGQHATLDKLGTGTAYEKDGYEFSGWKLYYSEETDSDGNLIESDVIPVLSGSVYKFDMPYYDTTARAIWVPSDAEYKVYHYFQNEQSSYELDKVSGFEAEAGETATIHYNENAYTGLVYGGEGSESGARIPFGTMGYVYFGNVVKDESGYTVTDTDLIAVVKDETFTSETDYAVADYKVDAASFNIYKYAYTQYSFDGDHETYGAEDAFNANPGMSLAYYYERATDYQVTAIAIATDGLDTDTTITGAGDCFYGQDIVLSAILAEGYSFKGWYNYDDIYKEDGTFTEEYENTFGKGEGAEKLTAVCMTLNYNLHVVGQYHLVAVVAAEDVELPVLGITGKSEYTYGYPASASNSLSVTVDLSEVSHATYIKGYQWMVQGPNDDEPQIIAGANAATYIIPAGYDHGDYDFTCQVTIGRKDNERSIKTSVSKTVSVTQTELPMKGHDAIYSYTGYTYEPYIEWSDSFTISQANAYGLEYYYSMEPLTASDYLEKYTADTPTCKRVNYFVDTYQDEELQFKDVNVDEDGNTIPYRVYYVIHDPKGNYKDLEISSTVTILPITLELKANTKLFSKVYDGNTDVDGSALVPGTEKYEIATNTYYTIEGVKEGEIETTLLDFDATFNDAHVKDASAVYLTNIKVYYANGSRNYNYTFADSYKINISAEITPFPLQAVWYDGDEYKEQTEFTYIYNGEKQAPTPHLVEGSSAPDGDFTLSVSGMQTNVGDHYIAQAIVEDKEGSYYSSDYQFTSEGCPFSIIKKKLLVITVDDDEVVYDGYVHTLDADVTATGYTDNDNTKDPIAVAEGSKDGLANDKQRVTFNTNKGYVHAGIYTDILPTDIKIEEEVVENDSTVYKNVTGNYDIYTKAGTLTINPRPVTLQNITAEDKYFDGNTVAELTFTDEDGNDKITFGNKLAADSLTYDSSKIAGHFSDALVGDNKDVSITFGAGTLGGDSIADYVLDDTPQTVKASILAKDLLVKAKALEVVYGQTFDYEYILEGLGASDASGTLSGTAVYKLYQYTDEEKTEKEYYTNVTNPDVGEYYIEVVTSGLSNGNYTIAWDSESWEDQTLKVTKRPVRVIASTASDPNNPDATKVVTKDYDGTLYGTATIRAIENFRPYYEFSKILGKDESGVLVKDKDNLKLLFAPGENGAFKATYDDKDVADATKVTLTNLKINDSNYELVTESFDVRGAIAPISLTIKADDMVDDDAICYGTTEVTYTATATGFLEDEESEEQAKITFTSTYDPTNSAMRGATVGSSYYIVTPVYENSNYDITIQTGNLQVDKAEITVTPVASKELIYGIDVDMPGVSPEYEGWKYTDTDSVITAGKAALSLISSIDCEVTSANVRDKLPDDYDMDYKDSVISALLADNYTFVNETGTLSIVKQELSISGIKVDDKVYDGTTNVAADKIDLSNVAIDYYIHGVYEHEEPTLEEIAERFTVTASYRDKNVGDGKVVDLDITLINDFASLYTFKLEAEGPVAASQTTATAGITPAPLTLTAKPRTLYFGEPLTFDDTKPGNYLVSGDPENPGVNDFVNGESYGDLYGRLTYFAEDGAHNKYRIGSPAGEYKVVIGGYNQEVDKVQNYDITFNNAAAIVLKIDPATLETPEPVWSAEKPGTIQWDAVPSIGEDPEADDNPNVVTVDHYELKLYKTTLANNAAAECIEANLIAYSAKNVSYEEGCELYEFDYADLVRENGPGVYQVQIKAIASTVNNAGYANVLKESKLGTNEKGLFVANVYVTFAEDATSQAAKDSVMPNFVIGPAQNSDCYTVIAGESEIDLQATMKNETGYSVKSCKGAFKNAEDIASASNPVGITISNGATDFSGTKAVYTAQLALSNAIQSSADRKVVLELQSTPATLKVDLALSRDHAQFGYTADVAPQFTVTASVEDSDNVTTAKYKYVYQWYTHDGAMSSYVAAGSPIESDSNTNTFTLPTGKAATAGPYYYAYCEVKAIRLDNDNSKTVASNKKLAATIDKADITDAVVTGTDWTYGETRTVFGVSNNPGNAPVTYSYSSSSDGTYVTTIPKDAGTYYVKAYIAATTNYGEFTTPAKEFKILQAKLATPDNIQMLPSDTAPYGKITWDAVTGPKENNGATGNSDMTIAVKYKVTFIYEKDLSGNAVDEELISVTTTDRYEDFTQYVTKAGTYKVIVQAIVGNGAETLEKAKKDCADSDESFVEESISIGTEILCDQENYTKVYDGTPMKLYVSYDVDGHTKYQWLKNNVPIEGATAKEYGITFVDENATYICKIAPTGDWTDEDILVYSTAAKAVITPRTLTISSQSAEKFYDGTALKWSDATYADGKTYSAAAMSGNTGIAYYSATHYDSVTAITQTASVTSAATDYNTASNTMSGIIITYHNGDATKVVYDESVKDVPGNTNNYIVTKVPGTLTVKKRAITVTAKSDSKVYDGTALTNAGYDLSFTNASDFVSGTSVIPDGETETVVVTGSMTNVYDTTTTNAVTNVAIKRGETDVTNCYTITTKAGTLEITPKPLNNGTAYADDISVAFPGVDPYSVVYGGDEKTPAVTVTDAGILVLGSAKVLSATSAKPDYQIDGYSNNINACDNTAVVTITGTNNYKGTITKTFSIKPLPVELSWSATSFPYDGTEKTVTATITNIKPNAGRATVLLPFGTPDEVSVATYADNQKTAAGNYTANALTLTGADAANYTLTGGTNINHNWSIGAIDGFVNITTTAAARSKVYDAVRILPVEFEKLGTGTVTLKYYTVSGSGAGKVYTELVETEVQNLVQDSQNLHRWIGSGKDDILLPVKAGTYAVKAFVTADNNYMAAESAYVEFVISKRQIQITSAGDTKVYDGQALVNGNYTVAGTDVTPSGLVTGQKEYVTITGTQTNVGKSDNTIASVVIKASAEVDAEDVTANYKIMKNVGELEVTKADEAISLAISGKVYDAEPVAEPVVTASGNGTVTITYYDKDKHVLGTGSTARPVEVGTYYATAKIEASQNYKDSETDYVEFKITKRPVVITAATDSKDYDGTALVNATYTVQGTGSLQSGLITGQKAVVVVTGSQTDAGTSDNVISSAKIYASTEADAAEVTDNYNITKNDGTLTVRKIDEDLHFTMSDKVYDGAPVSDPVVSHYGDATPVITYYDQNKQALSGAPKLVGTYYAKATITASTNHKDAETDFVEFKITKRPIVIVPAGDEKVYDGLPLTNSNYTHRGTEGQVESGLVSGQRIEITLEGSQTEVGSSLNKVKTVVIYDSILADANVVTSNYEIEKKTANLVVTAADETVSMTVLSKVYDGNAIAEPIVTKLGNGTVTITYYDANQQEIAQAPSLVGTYYAKAKVTGSTNHYDGETGFVEFEITKRPIEIKAVSDEKFYDGTALVNHDYEVLGTFDAANSGLAPNQSTTATVEGSQIVVGTSANVVTEIHIYKSGVETTDNYQITKTPGTLTVKKADESMVLTVLSKVYDAEPISAPSVTALGDGQISVVYYDKDKNVIGTGPENAPVEAGDYYAKAFITDSQNYKDAETEYVSFSIAKRPVTLKAKDASKVYDGQPLTMDGYEVVDMELANTGLVSGHIEIVTVEGSITNVGKTANQITNVMIIANGEGILPIKDVTKNYDIILEDGELEVTPADEELVLTIEDKIYDALPNTSMILSKHGDGAVSYIYYDSDKHELANAPVAAGDYFIRAEIKDSTNYKDQITDYVEFEILKREIVIKSASDSKVYDGTPLTNTTYVASGTEKTESGLVAGQKLLVTITGSQTVVGSSVNTIQAVKIYENSEETAQEVTDNYEISTEEGILAVTSANEDIRLFVSDKVYDGQPIEEPEVHALGDGTITITYYDDAYHLLDAAPKYCGTYYARAVISSSKNHVDGDTGYQVFRITKRPIVVIAASNEKIYDGTLLVDPGYTVEKTEQEESGLVEGQTIVVSVEGSRLDVGSSKNVVTSVQIYEDAAKTISCLDNYDVHTEKGNLVVTKAAGSIILDIEDDVLGSMDGKVYNAKPVHDPKIDVTGDGEVHIYYYDSKMQPLDKAPIEVGDYFVRGTLTGCTNYTDAETEYIPFAIVKRPVLVIAASDEKIYDGEALVNAGYIATATDAEESGLVEGQRMDALVEGSQTEVGSSDNVVTEVAIFESLSASAKEVTRNYELIISDGTLVVLPAEEILAIYTSDKIYDGKPIKEPIVVAVGDGEIVITYYDVNRKPLLEAPTEVGSYYAKATITGSTNYKDAETGFEAFEILKRPVIIRSASDEKVYDGEALTNSNYLVLGTEQVESGLATGQVAQVVVNGSQTEVGSSENEVTSVRIFADDTRAAAEVTANYDITIENGILRVKAADEDIVLSIEDKVYDGKPIAEPIVSAKGDGVITVTYYNSTKQQIAEAPITVGTYYVKAEIADSKNHKSADTGYQVFRITKRPIVIIAASDEKEYDGTPLVNALYQATGTGAEESGLVAGEKLSVTVEGSQTEVGSCKNVITGVEITDETGTSLLENYQVTKQNGKLKVTKAAGVIELDLFDELDGDICGKIYDGEPIAAPEIHKTGDGDVVLTYYDNNKQVIDSLPVEVGIYFVRAKLTNCTNYKNADTGYLPFVIEKRPIVITAASDEKEYDGTPLVNAAYVATGTDAVKSGLVLGERLEVLVTGSQTEVGSSVNEITKVEIFKSQAQDATEVTKNYSVYTKNGILKVTKADATISVSVHGKVYDGKPVDEPIVETAAEGTIVIKYYDANMQELDEVPTEVGTYYVVATVKDAKNHTDASTGYEVFEITKRPIAVRAGSATKVYDGIALTSDSFVVETEYTKDAGLVLDQKIEVSTSGSQTDVGITDNVITEISILATMTDADLPKTNSKRASRNGDTKDVTANYQIELLSGTLEVTKATGAIAFEIVDIDASILGKVYDGKPVSEPKVTIHGDGHAEIHYYDSQKSELNEAPTLVGDYYVKAFLVDSKNYTDAQTDYVAFAITKRPIVITAASAEKAYDGTALTQPAYTVSGTDAKESGLVPGQILEAETAGSQIAVGTSKNVISKVYIFLNNEEEVTANYEITRVDGTLTVVEDKPVGPDDPDEPDKPVDPDKPKTGDETNVAIYLIVLMFSGTYVATSLVRRKRENEDEE